LLSKIKSYKEFSYGFKKFISLTINEEYKTLIFSVSFGGYSVQHYIVYNPRNKSFVIDKGITTKSFSENEINSLLKYLYEISIKEFNELMRDYKQRKEDYAAGNRPDFVNNQP
jgi:hypothetical protein